MIARGEVKVPHIYKDTDTGREVATLERVDILIDGVCVAGIIYRSLQGEYPICVRSEYDFRMSHDVAQYREGILQ